MEADVRAGKARRRAVKWMLAAAGTLALYGSLAATAEVIPGVGAKEHPLPLPTSMTHIEYEKVLFPFIKSRAYATLLGWGHDKRIRDTGPYVKGVSFGTHPAVRVYYSPTLLSGYK